MSRGDRDLTQSYESTAQPPSHAAAFTEAEGVAAGFYLSLPVPKGRNRAIFSTDVPPCVQHKAWHTAGSLQVHTEGLYGTAMA